MEITKEYIGELKAKVKLGGILSVIMLLTIIAAEVSVYLVVRDVTDQRILNAANQIYSIYNSIFPFSVGVILIYLCYIVAPFLYYKNKIGTKVKRVGEIR